MDDDCYVVEVRDAIPAIPISYAFCPEPSSADSAAQVTDQVPLAAEPGPPPAPRVKTGKKPYVKKTTRKSKGPPKVPTGPLSGAQALVAKSG